MTNFLYFHLDSLVVCHLPHGPTARFGILNAVMRHDIPDIGTMPQEYPHLAFYNFKTKLGSRVCFQCTYSVFFLFYDYFNYLLIH